MKWKTIEKALLLSLILSMLLTITGFSGQCEDISNRVLRLHVLANSDSQEDQALKLQVRDKVLACSGDLLEETASLQEAEACIREHLDLLQSAAQQEVWDEGYDYPVTVELVNTYFNTREYDSVTLPAGRYDAVQVKIGAAQGKNWWCVMFPPMCLPAAEEQEELSDVLTPGEMEIVQDAPRFELRFKAVEIFESIKNWFASLGG
ncbi:MAG TPA: stage II sporulation protein R [Candidatus Gallacutalibacter stercoravium]|nr:stage II sporulation protein R [Candidatus Gallacutalibacter stercoravium]